jgi:putative tryptophan/tyrosine transport system substrate-binding protein
VRRRTFISLLGGAVAWPLAARAQERVRRIGVLMGYAESDWDAQGKIAAFREGLQKLGWAEGRNIRIDTRWPIPADAESMQRLAKELVALEPDLILSHITPTTAALLQQTRTIPIIFATVSDPIGSSFVASFSRPGGNVTGFTSIEPTMAGKWLELLKEIAPRRPGRLLVQPGNGAICRIFPEPPQSRRSVLRRGGDRSPCSRHDEVIEY